MQSRILALLFIAGCSFHIEGTTPPPPEPGITAPNAPTPTQPIPPTPTPPPSMTPNPTPTATSDMATTTTTTPPPPPMQPLDMAGTAPLVVHVGAACASNADCAEPDLKCFLTFGAGLGAIPLPGGYCSKACSSKVACPTGSECVATLVGAFCLNQCSTDGNNNACRAGYSCCESVGACGLDTFCGN